MSGLKRRAYGIKGLSHHKEGTYVVKDLEAAFDMIRKDSGITDLELGVSYTISVEFVTQDFFDQL
jgi:hypothetical protein